MPMYYRYLQSTKACHTFHEDAVIKIFSQDDFDSTLLRCDVSILVIFKFYGCKIRFPLNSASAGTGPGGSRIKRREEPMGGRHFFSCGGGSPPGGRGGQKDWLRAIAHRKKIGVKILF